MQKFGLQRNSNRLHSAIELEIVKEQASVLGRAGRKLRLSLEKYEGERNQGFGADRQMILLQEISNNVWELVLQREFVGFIEGNLDWIKQNYVIPDEALSRLGKSN